MAEFAREVAVLSRLIHPRIVRCYGVCLAGLRHVFLVRACMRWYDTRYWEAIDAVMPEPKGREEEQPHQRKQVLTQRAPDPVQRQDYR